ncbi:MAG: hypothetical protein ACTSQE_05610, partial [Candidatus Heimdallarchaeaceae archaeon]
ERVNMTIVGIYAKPSYGELNKLCKKYALSTDLTEKISKYIGAITYNEYYLSSIKDMPVQHLRLDGFVQFGYNYSLITADNFRQLIADFDAIKPGFDHAVKFDIGGSWTVTTEMKSLLLKLAPDFTSTQFLIILLSIPVIYLSIFLIFETNALFSTSFEEEIEILRSKGLSTAKIVYINTFMKVIESFFATFLGFGGAVLIIPPLLKIDRFLSFNQPINKIIFSYLPVAMVISFFSLVFITLPLTVRMSKLKKAKTRTAKKFVSFLKKIKILNLIIIGVGGAIIYGGVSLYQAFSTNLATTDSSMILIFIYIVGMGVMITLLGLGLILKDIHSLVMIGLSRTLWKAKKSIFSFSLVEIRTDISLFNDIFLTYLLLIGITVPAIVAPLTIQNGITSDSHFLAGADMYVKDWNRVNQSIKNEIASFPGIVSVSNISQVDAMFGGRQIYLLVLDDALEFYKTAYKPSERFFKDWDEKIPLLEASRTMLVSTPFKNYYDISDDNTYTYTINGGANVEFEIVSEFDYFPIVYPYGPRETGGTPTIITTYPNFQLIEEGMTLFGIYGYRLLINVDDNVDPNVIADQLEEKYSITIITAKEKENEMYTDYIPFYPSIVSTLIFALLISLISIVFTSMSNPLKILQKRIGKHDILKKMGVPNSRIIQMSSFELFIIGILPGILVGGAAGFTITRVIIWMFKDLREGTLPTLLRLPPIAMLMIFVFVPALFFLIFYLTMKAQFAAYEPMNLE